MTGLLDRCVRALGPAPSAAYFVPGRVEVLGKHTDYAGGRSLLAALDRGFIVAVAPRGDATVSVTDAGSGERVAFPLSAHLEVLGGWANYPMTVARRLARDFPGAVAGADIAFASDLPPAAGMSSSSALVVVTFLALREASGLESSAAYREGIRDDDDLAGYLAAVESGKGFGPFPPDRGVGTQGGSEDHVAILGAWPGKLVRYSFAPIGFEGAVPLPESCTFALASSGVRAEKTGGARERYNEASALARAVADAWNAATGRNDPHIAAALRSAPDARARLRTIAEQADADRGEGHQLRNRLDHFLAESEEIVPAATAALGEGDLARFGAEVDRSQRLADELLDNQVEETIHLAVVARELGAAAASAFGAGFGGSVWALVQRDGAGDFLSRWRTDYLERFPERAADSDFFLSDAGPPARRIL